MPTLSRCAGLLTAAFISFASAIAGAAEKASRLPGPELDLRLTAPITTWDEAIPLGNGLTGGLLWGEGNLIRLSLERGDLWDERLAPGDPLSKFTYAQMVKLVAEKKNAEISRVVDAQGYDQKQLDIFVKAFILRNGFHANGDQTQMGFSSFTYRPFTLEGNFLAAAAVHEMLLQSWSAKPGSGDWGVIRIFPATPWRWHEVSFEDLRAEGGHRVSAKRENNATTWFRVVAGREGVVHIRDNFGGRTPKWNRSGVAKAGDNFEIRLKSGQVVEATLAKPDRVPAAPADAAEVVLIRH